MTRFFMLCFCHLSRRESISHDKTLTESMATHLYCFPVWKHVPFIIAVFMRSMTNIYFVCLILLACHHTIKDRNSSHVFSRVKKLYFYWLCSVTLKLLQFNLFDKQMSHF